MTISRVDYDREYEVCERENIKSTGRIQSGLYLIARHSDGAVTRSANLTLPAETLLTALDQAPERIELGRGYHRIETEEHGPWLRHEQAGAEIFERVVLDPSDGHLDGAGLNWDTLTALARGNLFKFSQLFCRRLQDLTGAERVMIYRFAEDWSGEVIAEAVEPQLDPYLGLHYPPTDIPRQARQLFELTGSRHIFSTLAGEIDLLGPGDTAPLDLSFALGRSVSPYHIEYLRNMGSESTASCALMVDGQLWGLVSLHYCRSRHPSLEEFQLLQAVARDASDALSALLHEETRRNTERLARIKARFSDHLEAYSDPFNTLVLSSYAAHRAVNGQGLSILIGDKLANVGRAPSAEVTQAIAEKYAGDLAEGACAFIEEYDADIPEEGRRGLAGCAIARLSAAPNALLIVHRVELNQRVNWGGDPRRPGAQIDSARFTPRQSFRTWVERVSGRCAPWTPLNRDTLASLMTLMTEQFEATPRELTLLIRNGYRQALKRRDLVRGSALDFIDGIQTAVAVAIEEAGETEGRVIALNRTATEAFAITPAEIAQMSVGELEAVTGVDLPPGVETSFTTTITTALEGVRECDVFIGLLFEAIDLSGESEPYRVQVFEFRDITEAKRIEASLKAARDRAVRDAELRAEFFAKLGHELKTPLNGLIGLSDLLLRFEQDNMPDRVTLKLGLIREASDHMAGMISSTLDNAAAVQYVDSSAFEPVYPLQVAASAVDLLHAQIEERGLTIKLEGDADLTGFTDARGLRQVLLNLLSNAVKYSFRGGEISVHVAARDQTFVSVRIVDSGPGMSPDQVERCMTPYIRFAEGEGAGLGLSIANHLMSMMGGVIQIRSTEGIGTEAEVVLPAEAEHFGPAAAQ